MDYEVIDPRKGFKITELEARFIKMGYATSINSIRFPYKEDMPEFMKSAPVTEGFLVVPEIRFFAPSKRDARAFEYHEVKHRLNHYQINGIDIIHWMMAVMDDPYSPLVTEFVINPYDEGSKNVWYALKTCPFLLINIFHKETFYQSRFCPNIFLEKINEIDRLLPDDKVQSVTDFLRAKFLMERQYPCDYRPYNDFSDGIRTVKINWI